MSKLTCLNNDNLSVGIGYDKLISSLVHELFVTSFNGYIDELMGGKYMGYVERLWLIFDKTSEAEVFGKNLDLENTKFTIFRASRFHTIS